jgi:exopolysaccharide biosynthesis polyprenyl glycosylphosphotransferase
MKIAPLHVRTSEENFGAADLLTHSQIAVQIAVGDTCAFVLQRHPLGAGERLFKRAMDMAVSCFGLCVLCPLMLLVAAAIRLDTAGPILFRQVRMGINGRLFHVLKFRTMSVMENGTIVTQAAQNDSRVTPVGRCLRRSSIDELPQLFNVVRGDMSLVGPRPHALAHANHYMNLIANYAHRHDVRPGITGWAQVNGFRGATSELTLMQRRVELDLWYIAHWSPVLDFWIVIRTFFEVVRMRNAF